MTRFTVTLSEELARYVSDALDGGAWASADELFAYALGLARTASVLGKPPALTPAPVVNAGPTPPADPTRTSGSGTVAAVDLTRQSFDSSQFMGELTRKLHDKK